MLCTEEGSAINVNRLKHHKIMTYMHFDSVAVSFTVIKDGKVNFPSGCFRFF